MKDIKRRRSSIRQSSRFVIDRLQVQLLSSAPFIMKKIKLKGQRFSLRRERDGAGDSGLLFTPFDWKNHEETGETGEIIVGLGIKCGSHYARTMQYQDWWLTTPVTEIISISSDQKEAKFRTGNSVYIAKVI